MKKTDQKQSFGILQTFLVPIGLCQQKDQKDTTQVKRESDLLGLILCLLASHTFMCYMIPYCTETCKFSLSDIKPCPSTAAFEGSFI